jgi:TonB-linked SusC/RagA family outer membrane protein
MAQTTIKGTVKDIQGPIPGASIYEKDVPNNGVQSNIDGTFSLTLTGNSKVLVVKFIGYITQEVNVAGKSTVNITMETDAKGLEEVVVVAYGKQKKITTTGSISTISAKEIQQNPTASIQNALAGRLPGFFSQQRSGQPGADGAQFFIRGISTYEGDVQPLIIVDDIEYEYEKVSDLDPNEIESISILKDASTTAVYGIRGANGVLIITTKRGNEGKPTINLKTEAGFQFDVNRPEFLNSYDALSLRNETYENYGDTTKANKNYLSKEILQKYKDQSDPYRYPDIDWWSTIFKKGSMLSRTNLDFRGGSKSVKYFVSTGFLWQNGSIRNFNNDNLVNNNYYYKRYNFRSNLDITATKTLKLRLDLTGRFDEQNEPYGSNFGNGLYANGNGIVGEIFSYGYLPPWAFPVRNPDGSYPYNDALTNSNTSIIGRLAELGYSRSFDNDLGIVASANQDLNFVTRGLSASVLVSYNSSQTNKVSASRPLSGIPFFYYQPETGAYLAKEPDLYVPTLYATGSSNTPIYRTINSQSKINYIRDFGQHTIYALALYNDQRVINSKTSNNDPDGNYALQGPGVPTIITGTTFRLGYDFADKYLLEFNAARNGTDRFRKDRRFSWFPAVSVGWNVAEESFFKNNIKFINLLKLRASYGLTGSDAINGALLYEARYKNGSNYYFGSTPRTFSSIEEEQLGNYNVTWEKERKLNLALDLSLFDGKLKLTAEYFDNYRYDILTTRKSVPLSAALELPKVNLGEVQNRGFEGELNFNQRIKENINLDFRLTYSHAANKILYLDEATPAYPWLAATGRPIGQYYGWEYIGFYTKEDIADPNVAKPFPSNNIGPGDLKYKDINGDGVIDKSDAGYIGKPNLPTDVFGANFNFRYKSFGFNMFFQGSFNYSMRFNSESIIPGNSNYQPVHLGRWTEATAATATFPRLGGGAPTNFPNGIDNNSTFWIRNNYYVRFKTAEINYTLPTSVSKKLRVSGIRVFTNANNLITWTNATDLFQVDPENGVDGNKSTVSKFYPTQRIYNFGVNVTF